MAYLWSKRHGRSYAANLLSVKDLKIVVIQVVYNLVCSQADSSCKATGY